MNDTARQMFEMRRAMRPFVGILYSLARHSETGNILEIGVRQGQSTRTILGALSDRGSGMLTSIDIRDRTERIPESLRPYWNQVVGNSHEQKAEDAASEFSPYDFVLIDGDHSSQGCRQDWLDYGPMCRKGGLVLFHDVINPDPDGGVQAFWNDLTATKVTLDTWPGFGIVSIWEGV